MNLREAIADRGTSTLCVSLSSNPGTFGTTIHNAGYAALGLDYKYVACKETDIAQAMAQVREFGVRGASISMPFKIDVMDHIDWLDDSAFQTGAVNTVVNDGRSLTGYNTDVVGFRVLADKAHLEEDELITVIGTGGVARAVLEALRGYSNVVICGRHPIRRQELADFYKRPHHGFYELRYTTGTIINCTPIGMNDEKFPMSLLGLTRVIDLVVKETPLVREARALGIRSYSGATMAFHGAAKQFELYTGMEAPVAIMQEALSGST